ncbi:helix-turn-helix domain-containing protein [Trinickia mobilis]|uniref:helix-turn-helix domain-containing protein n=1 Tax=Trinickia mobilis TaxID=2816356 RepID=UPI001A90ABDC|nr:LysR family transcriptional regulator [Trinickia mobilis]
MGAPKRKDGLNWNLLRDFSNLIRHETFSDAADALGISRPAVSKRIAELEESLGFLLVERTRGKRELRLTESGRRLRAAVIDFEQNLAALRGDTARSEIDVLTQAEDIFLAAHDLVITLQRQRRVRTPPE